MSAIIFHWIQKEGAKKEGMDNAHARKFFLTRWTLMAKAFALSDRPNMYCVTNDKKVQIKDIDVNFKVFTTLEEAIEYAKDDGEHVFIEEGGTPLREFNHPKEAVYIFGCDFGRGLSCDNAVTINAKRSFHAEIAAGIVLESRYNQWH